MARRPKSNPAPAYRADGWFNAFTALGVAGADKRKAADFYARRISEFEAEEVWRGDDIIARIVETLPRVMFRNGFDVSVSDETPSKPADPPKTEKGELSRLDRARRDKLDQVEWKKGLAKKLSELKVVSTYIEAMDKARAFGGSAILLGVDENGRRFEDATRFEEPLDLRRVKDVRWLTVLRPHECQPASWYGSMLSPDYGKPKTYRVVRDTMGGGGARSLLVHESRLIPFFGIVTSTRQRAMNNSWGDSILLRVLEVVSDFQQAHQASAHLMLDFAQAVMKVKGLFQLVVGNQSKAIEKRAELVAMSRSVARMVMLDSEEEFERAVTPVTGLPELLDRQAQRVAAAAQMPVTLLMGQAPAGLNATGDSDIRWYYDYAANERELHLRERLDTLIRTLFRCTEGPTAGVEPAGWKVNFHPLWQPTQKELAEIRKMVAETDALYLSNQVTTPEEVAESRWGGDEYSMETKLNIELREKMNDAHATFVDEQLEQGKMPASSAHEAGQQQRQAESEDKKLQLRALPGGMANGGPPQPGAPRPASQPAPAGGAQQPAQQQQPNQQAGEQEQPEGPRVQLNGAQVTSAQSIVEACAAGQLPRETALNMLVEFFNLDPKKADFILGEVGRTFVPKPPPAPEGEEPKKPAA